MNVEPNVVLYSLFEQERPDDINLNVGVGNVYGTLQFYSLNPHTLSTFDYDVVKGLEKTGDAVLIAKEDIQVILLSEVFQKVNRKQIDLLNIDVEGLDQEVLEGNDWDTYRATLICIEDHTGKKFTEFFKEKGYRRLCHNGLNSFFIDMYYEHKR